MDSVIDFYACLTALIDDSSINRSLEGKNTALLRWRGDSYNNNNNQQSRPAAVAVAVRPPPTATVADDDDDKERGAGRCCCGRRRAPPRRGGGGTSWVSTSIRADLRFRRSANAAAGGGSGHSWYKDVDNDGSFFCNATSWERIIATGDQRSTPTRTTALRWRCCRSALPVVARSFDTDDDRTGACGLRSS
jgi:hypothetical protein